MSISATLNCQKIIKKRISDNKQVYNFGLGANPIKQPDFFMEVSNFPKTSSGKIKKNLLIEWIENKNLSEIDKISLVKETNKIKKINSKKTITISNIVKNSVQASSVQINNFVYEKISKGEKIITLSLGEAFFKIPLFNFNRLPLNKSYHYSLQ